MERCSRRLQYRHKQFLSVCLLPCIMALILLMADVAGSDDTNLLRNGDFRGVPIQFQSYPVQDVFANGMKNLLPYWTCVRGGVQLWDAILYIPRVEDAGTTYIVHMNSQLGGGHIISTPMYTPRKDAEYVVSMSLACNPHGGPMNQSLMAVVFDDQGNEVQPKPNPFVLTANPNSSLEDMFWERVSFKMIGTGKRMYLYLASKVTGFYGLLVANVQVNLANLVDNGSFENLTLTSDEIFSNVTMDVTLEGPRPTAIPRWSVESGKVRISVTGKDTQGAFQAATDGGRYSLELNAAGSPGEISTTFEVPTIISTAKEREFVLLFDTAANPIHKPPQTVADGESPYAVVGRLGIKVTGVQSSQVLLAQDCEMNGTGFDLRSVGWMTRNYTFKMAQDKTAKVTFKSLAEGNYGPLLDNVCVYEVVRSKSEWVQLVGAPEGKVPSAAKKHMLTVDMAERFLVVFVMTTLLLDLTSVR